MPTPTPNERTGAHAEVTFATFCIAAFFICLTSFSLFTIEKIKTAYLASRSSFSPQSVLDVVGIWDGVIVALGAIFFVTIVMIELRHHAVRRLLEGKSTLSLVVVIGAVVLWFSHAMMAPGLIVVGDGGSHVSRVNHLRLALQDGSSVYWDNYFFGGGTLLQFTGPVFHWLGAGVALITDDATTAVKIVLVAARFIATGFMYLFLRRLNFERTTAFFGAIFYAGSFFVTYMISIRAGYPQSLNLALLPAILYFLENILADRKILSASWLGLCLATVLIIGNHQPTALMAAILVAAYLLVRFAMGAFSSSCVVALILAGAAVAISSIYFVLPFMVEHAWTADDFSLQIIRVGAPDLRPLLNYFVWGKGGAGPVSTSYLGLSIILCAASGGYALFRPEGRALPASRFWLLFIGLTFLSLFLKAAYVRQTVFTLFFLCAAAAASIELLLQLYPKRTFLPSALFVLFLVDLAPTAIQPWLRPDMQSIERAGEALAERSPNQRVLEVGIVEHKALISVGPDSSPLHYARVQMLYGPHKMDATKAHNSMVAILQAAQADLNQSNALSSDTIGLLSIDNVGWVVGHEVAAMGLPREYSGTEPDPVIGSHWRIPTATPIVASGTLSVVPRPVDFGGLALWLEDFFPGESHGEGAIRAAKDAYHAMDVDLLTHQARDILITSPAAGDEWKVGDGKAPSVKVIEYNVGPGRVHLAVSADHPGFLRLAHPFFPTTAVTLNGKAIQPIADVFSFIVVPIDAGINEIDLVPTPSMLRRICFFITAFTMSFMLVLAVVLAAASRLRSHRDQPATRTGQHKT